MNFVCGLIVKNKDVKKVKTVLEEKKLSNKYLKIRPHKEGRDQSIIPSSLRCGTYLNAGLAAGTVHLDVSSVLKALRIDAQSPATDLIEDVVAVEVPEEFKPMSAFETAMLQALEAAQCQPLPCPLTELIDIMPKSYSIYSTMLLLPFQTFRSPHWRAIVSMLDADAERKKAFFSALATQMAVSHVAINAIIPAWSTLANHEDSLENILRSPTNLQPIYGDFGNSLPAYPQHIPTSTDYAEAFWVSTKQNKIQQCWAPRYTMFSAGNVTEKARLLTLPSVTAAIELGNQTGRGCTAVDLFAGIGYFAFSYVRAGCAKVLCWDLNPWSIEGLKRGASMNQYGAHVIDFERDMELVDRPSIHDRIMPAAQDPSVKLIAFRERNQNAMMRIKRFRYVLPPIRHVNCGTLPKIGAAWKTAAEALDPRLGGHIHLHETCPENETTQRANHYVELILQYAKTLHRGNETKVELEHIETVKSIGPRLLHVVFDIRIDFHT